MIGAAFVAQTAGFLDIITYDMGGTSTDVATVLDGRPQWTTASQIDGLPIGLPMFDIHTVGAGGGSVAYVDQGGALRVGPRSAGATPGPACYCRGGTEPAVTDANLALGRIVPENFLGGEMTVDVNRANRALSTLANVMGKSMGETALGIVRIVEANMIRAIRAVTSQRGHDPRRFTLVSFGGAGGLHACALAQGLEIPRVLVPPYCGVLSALGMVVAPIIVDASRTVVQLASRLDDKLLAAELAALDQQTAEKMPNATSVESHADVRFRGQSHEVKVRIEEVSLAAIRASFHAAYRVLYGHVPEDRPVEIVTLRLRRVGEQADLRLPRITPDKGADRLMVKLFQASGQERSAPAMSRSALLAAGKTAGPALIIDPEATTYLPPGWNCEAREDGSVICTAG